VHTPCTQCTCVSPRFLMLSLPAPRPGANALAMEIEIIGRL
jgi:hypothetical protein